MGSTNAGSSPGLARIFGVCMAYLSYDSAWCCSARASSNLVDVAFFLVIKVCYFFMAKKTTATRFELAEPSRFRIYLLHHSDTLPLSTAQSWPSG